MVIWFFSFENDHCQLSEEPSFPSLLSYSKYAKDYTVVSLKSFHLLYIDRDGVGLLLNGGHQVYEVR